MSEKLRVQVLLTEEERERFRRCAAKAGTSLSTWLREAGLAEATRRDKRDQLDTVEKLEAFFAECAERNRDRGREPDWDDVKKMILDSKSHGIPRP